MQVFNRNHLKLIACATMLVDHVAAAFQFRGAVFFVMRLLIGRIAFPLFGFLLVEGFFYTKSRWKYLLRIAVLAVLSEVPYDLLFHGHLPDWSNQNILFLLALALGMLVCLQAIRSRGNCHFVLAWLLQLSIIAGASAAAWVFRFDYGVAGICMIAAMYYVYLYADQGTALPFSTAAAIAAGVLALNLIFFLKDAYATPGAFLAVLPALFYNNRRGKIRAKYAFYLFYPAHLAVLLFIMILQSNP